jgi:hypothetical protein
MALAPLASVADLPFVWQTADDADRALVVASAAIRDAAGSAIGVLTSTVTVTGHRGRLLRLPGPVSTVTAVTVDGTAVTDYRVLPDGLWRQCGWDKGCGPVAVTVAMTHGLTDVPPDIVDLCVQLAVAWLQHLEGGGGSTAGLTSAAIDDARETYSDESAGQVSPVYIPEATRNWLAARFGGGMAVVETA